MNIQEISTFLAVCKYGAFSKAAEQLYMTQPTVSWYISSLEKELGHQLFIRKRGQKGIIMTDAGKIFYQQAIKWEALWNETKMLLEKKSYTRYNFACVHSLSHQLIPFLHSWFENAMPDCSVSMTSRPSGAIISGLENKEYDAGLAVMASSTDRAIITPFASEKMVFVCRKDSTYPDQVRVNDLNIAHHICINWTEDLKSWRQNYFYGRPYAELNSFDELMYFFSKPEIWSILPYTSWYYMQDKLKICELDHPPKNRNFYLATSTPPKEDFTLPVADALKEFFQQFDQGIQLLQ